MKQLKIFKQVFNDGWAVVGEPRRRREEVAGIDEEVNAWIKKENANVVNIRVDYFRYVEKTAQSSDLIFEQYTATVIYEIEDKPAKSFKKG
jgi:hypothetical protein